MNSISSRRQFLSRLGLGLASASLPWIDSTQNINQSSISKAYTEPKSPLKQFKTIPIADCHFHMHGTLDSIDWILNLEDIMQACALQRVNILSSTARLKDLNDNFIIATTKAAYPTRVYAFGGLMHHYPATNKKYIDLGEQAKILWDIGFDGFKMIDGKPSVREEIGYPMDGAKYAPYWEYLHSTQAPLLWHVADPWNGSEPPKDIEKVYNEAENVLNRYPNLQVIFAHFYFFSHVLDRAAKFLDRYPNISFDLTPHGAMYSDFSKNPEKARDFFIKYQDRIVFGTDNHGEARNFGPGAPLEYWPVHKLIAMRKFLETDEEFTGWHQDLRGIALPNNVLEKIYQKNLYRYTGKVPTPFDRDKAIDVCNRIVFKAKQYGVIHDLVDEARKCMKSLISVTST